MRLSKQSLIQLIELRLVPQIHFSPVVGSSGDHVRRNGRSEKKESDDRSRLHRDAVSGDGEGNCDVQESCTKRPGFRGGVHARQKVGKPNEADGGDKHERGAEGKAEIDEKVKHGSR